MRVNTDIVDEAVMFAEEDWDGSVESIGDGRNYAACGADVATKTILQIIRNEMDDRRGLTVMTALLEKLHADIYREIYS